MKKLLTSVSNFMCHPVTKRVIYMASTLAFIFCLILLISMIKGNDTDLIKKMKELNEKTKALEDKQKEYDNKIAQYRTEIYDLDYQISNIKEKTTIIREYYKEKQAEIDTFNYKQIDSFFRKKYQY